MVFTLSSSVEPDAGRNDRRAPEQPDFAPGRIIVGLDSGVTGAADQLVADIPGAYIELSFDGLEGMLVLGLPSDLSVVEALARVDALTYVRFAEPDYIVSIAASEDLSGDTPPLPAAGPEDDGSGFEGPPPEVARCIAVEGWWLDFQTETLTDEAGNVIGYLEISTGLGFASLVEYDAGRNLVHSEYSDINGFRSTSRRETLTNDAGSVTGYRESSRGGGGGYSYESTALYDASFRLIEADHSDSEGYVSSTRRSELRDDSGSLTGYLAESSGSGSASSYTSTELFDVDFTLLNSDFRNSEGYYSSYQLDIERDDAGNISGYVSTYSWNDGADTYTSVDRFDAHWNYIDGDFDGPVVIVDDGPGELPVVSLHTGDIARTAFASAETTITDVKDGRAEAGAQLKGTAENDVFLVDDRRDWVLGGKGEDMVVSADMTLDLRRAAFGGIENAALAGREALNLQGDRGSNELRGNSGDNRIDGRDGVDTLFGGFGEDVFVIRGGRGASDRITDFTSGEDTVQLTGRTFRGLFERDGGLRAEVIGDRLLFDANSGELTFDRDGSAGRSAGVVVAVLVGVREIDADDFTAG